MRVNTIVAVLLLALALPLGSTFAADPCASDRATLAKMNVEIAKLQAEVLPDLAMKDMLDVITSLQNTFDGSKKDIKELSKGAEDAKRRLEAIKKGLTAGRQALPPGWERLESAIDKLVSGIGDGLKGVADSGAGKAMKSIDAGTKHVAIVSDALARLKTAATLANALGDAKRGAGAEQMRALAAAFDVGLGASGASSVPGLGEALGFFSTALKGAAGLFAPIQEEQKRRFAEFTAMGTDVSYGDLAYMSPRERNKEMLKRLTEARAALQDQMVRNGCNAAAPPPAPELPCQNLSEAVKNMQRLVAARTRALREKYEADLGRYNEGQRALLPLLRDIDSPEKSQNVRQVERLTAQLDDILRTNANNAKREADLRILGEKLGMDGLNKVGRADPLHAMGGLIRAELGSRMLREMAAATTEYNKASEALLKQRKAMSDRVKELGQQMRQSRAAYYNLVRETIAQETKAKNFTAAQLQEIEDCDPLRAETRAAPSKPAIAKPPAKTATGVTGVCAAQPQPAGTVRGEEAAQAVEKMMTDAKRRLNAAETQFSKGAKALYEACFREAGVNSHAMQYTDAWSSWFYTGSWSAAYGFYSRAQESLTKSAAAARTACWVRKSFEPDVRREFDAWASRESGVISGLRGICTADAQRARILGEREIVFKQSFEKGNPQWEAQRRQADEMHARAEEVRKRNASSAEQFARQAREDVFVTVLP